MQGANRLSKQLTTSKRARMTEPHASTSIGGWNPDATDSNRPIADMAQMRNVRKMSADAAETRSGYKQWKWLLTQTGTDPDTGHRIFSPPRIPLAQCEYRLDENFVNVVIYAEKYTVAGVDKLGVFAQILHPTLEPHSANATDGTGDGTTMFRSLSAHFDHSIDGHPFNIGGTIYTVTCVDATTLTLSATLAAGTYPYFDTIAEIISAAEYDLSVNPLFPQANPVTQIVHIVDCTVVAPVEGTPGHLVAQWLVPVVAVRQYQTYVVVSIVDDAEAAAELGDYFYGIYPTLKDLSSWIALPIGKDVCPAPASVTFSPTVTGKLLCFTPQGLATSNLNALTNYPLVQHEHTLTGYQPDVLSGENALTALDIKAPYFLADTGAYVNLPEPKWKRNKKDPVSGDVGGIDHLKSRGWQYRFRYKRKFHDVRDNEIIVASSPSADTYVEDTVYCPPVQVEATPQGQAFPLAMIGGTIAPTLIVDRLSINAPLQFGIPLPNTGQLRVLRQKFIDAVGNIDNPDDPLFFVSVALGAQSSGHSDYLIQFGNKPFSTTPAQPTGGLPPYKLDPSSYEITQAPNAIFNFADFHGIPADAYAIDVYRTAYCYPNPKDSDLHGTGYAPYVYGYVGTITAPDVSLPGTGIFVDDVQDTAIQFDKTPLQSEGYLIGQFAGEVMRQYQTHMTLGNTREKYWLKTPWTGMQSFSYLDATDGQYNGDDFALIGGDGQPLRKWFYAYSDSNKKLSDAVPITTDAIIWQNGQSVAFLFPRGYSSTIESVLLIQSIWTFDNMAQGTCTAAGNVITDPSATFTSAMIGQIVILDHKPYLIDAQTTTTLTLHTVPPAGGNYYIPIAGTGSRRYYKEAYVGVADGTYLSHSFTPPGAGEILAPTFNADGSMRLRDVTLAHDPGFLIWSRPSDLWSWPQENISDLHDQDPITGLDEVIGPLYTWSDKGEVMTRDDADGAFGYVEPVHTSGTGAGSLSRLAICKIGEVVFTLCSNGLIYTGGAGVASFPATIHQQIVKRLRERIAGRPPLYGVRNRISMGYLPNRSELWITFPSTIESDEYGFLGGGAFPAQTFILKFLVSGSGESERKEIFAYEFELCGANDGTTPNPTSIVIHTTHADGALFSAFYDRGDPDNPNVALQRMPAMIVQDNDRPELPWMGLGILQWQNALNMPNMMKMLFSCRFTAAAQCKLYLGRGMLRTDGANDPVTGTLWPDPVNDYHASWLAARELAIQSGGERAEYYVPFGGELTERAGTPPAIRLITKPTTSGPDAEHWFDIEQLDVFYGPMHQHKP